MGLKCSLLGHSYEPAGVDREREEQGSEVVTVVRELEECTRCGKERVVSESTEVTAVVDADDVSMDEADVDEGTDPDTGDALGGVVDRSDVTDEESTPDGRDDGAAVDDFAESPGENGTFEARDPEEEDAEILTDDEPEREPGEWPEETQDESWEPDVEDESLGEEEDDEEESLSGITVPEGSIVCPECGFEADAESSYRDGDPCPECGAWLRAE